MKEKTEDVMRAEYLAFVGKVSASLSHEIKNTLAIIGETSGLIRDLLEYSPPPSDWETFPRFKDLLTSIAGQVDRSVTIVTRLNRFAHSMDDPMVSLELNELLQDINNLAQRFASLKEVRLETHPCNGRLPVKTDPFRLQQVVFGFIDRGLRAAPKDSSVTVTSGQSDGQAQIVITDEGPCQAESINKQVSAQAVLEDTEKRNGVTLSVLGLIVSQLGGSIEAENLKPQGNRITIKVPLESK
jgi:C4-dicarboxylate-specific signal transduction histidine kinase